MRQCRSRYAIRAGRILPDEEFRDLRTVMVTAVVHRGFGLELPLPEGSFTPPLNRTALDRRQPIYFGSHLSIDLCF